MLTIPTEHTHAHKNIGKFLEMMDMLNTLVVIMTSQVYTYVQTHQKVFIKCVNFFVYQINFNKAKNNNSKDWKKTTVIVALVFYDHWGINEASQIFWGP